jgi:hypothetical protein
VDVRPSESAEAADLEETLTARRNVYEAAFPTDDVKGLLAKSQAIIPVFLGDGTSLVFAGAAKWAVNIEFVQHLNTDVRHRDSFNWVVIVNSAQTCLSEPSKWRVGKKSWRG